MGPIGWPETVFIVILALLLFGPKKLPELGRTLGKAITEFRRASADLRSTFDREMRNLEREAEVVKEQTTTHFHDSYNYDYSSYDTGTNQLAETAPTAHESSPDASAASGVSIAAADTRPALTVTPAPGIVENGSLRPEAPIHSEPEAVAHGDRGSNAA